MDSDELKRKLAEADEKWTALEKEVLAEIQYREDKVAREVWDSPLGLACAAAADAWREAWDAVYFDNHKGK